jgi:hypothetical protein
MNKATSLFAIAVGCCMIVMWTFLLASGNVKETSTEPLRILFHIISEVLTGTVLVAAGILMFRRRHIGHALYYLSTGALVYSLINALGYYLEFYSLPFLALFVILLAGTLFFLLAGFRK